MTPTYSEKEIKDFLHAELTEYEEKFGGMTGEECHNLREWVRDGNSVYSNPFIYSDGDGYPMDYISAIRVNEEMIAHPEHFQWSCPAEYGALLFDGEPF